MVAQAMANKKLVQQMGGVAGFAPKPNGNANGAKPGEGGGGGGGGKPAGAGANANGGKRTVQKV